MSEGELRKEIESFIVGLLKKAKCKHSGNCYAMCQILTPYLRVFYGIDTLMGNCKVVQGNKKVNHYYLMRIKDGKIIDATASQFKFPNGKRMPKVYIGEKPFYYIIH